MASQRSGGQGGRGGGQKKGSPGKARREVDRDEDLRKPGWASARDVAMPPFALLFKDAKAASRTDATSGKIGRAHV